MVILSCSFFSIMHFVFTTSYTGISLCFFISDIFISDIFISGIFISGILCVKFQIILLLCSFQKKVHVNLYPIKFCVLCIQSNSVYFNQCFYSLQFFMDATKPAEEEPLFSPSPDINIEEIGHSIEETLDSADRLTDRLGELNSQMVDWLTNFAINKASTK